MEGLERGLGLGLIRVWRRSGESRSEDLGFARVWGTSGFGIGLRGFWVLRVVSLSFVGFLSIFFDFL